MPTGLDAHFVSSFIAKPRGRDRYIAKETLLKRRTKNEGDMMRSLAINAVAGKY